MNEPENVADELADNEPFAHDFTAEEEAELMRRVQPDDGTRLLVAASFNSAI